MKNIIVPRGRQVALRAFLWSIHRLLLWSFFQTKTVKFQLNEDLMGSCGKLRVNNYTITMSSLFQLHKTKASMSWLQLAQRFQEWEVIFSACTLVLRLGSSVDAKDGDAILFLLTHPSCFMSNPLMRVQLIFQRWEEELCVTGSDHPPPATAHVPLTTCEQ